MNFDFRSYRFSAIRYDYVYDRFLHESLTKLFSSLTRHQIKELIRDKDYIVKLIVEQVPILSRLFFNEEELRKLPLLWIAVLCCYQKTTKLLVRSGADVNEPFGSQDPQIIDETWTILHLLLRMESESAKYDEKLMIRLVVDHGADLQARDSSGRTALHLAIEHNRSELTELFLDRGAAVNVVDEEGNTPLLLAANKIHQSYKLLPLLMSLGADASAEDKNGLNVLYHVTRLRTGNDIDLARALIRHGASPAKGADLDHYQSIHWAVHYNKIEFVKLFLDHGANVNAQTRNGESPLYIAVRHRFLSIMKILLKRGADVDLRTIDSGWTALHVVCSRIYHRDFFKLLLSAGADVLTKDRQGRTPFELINRMHLNNNNNNTGVRLMVKALALRKARQPLIELKEEGIIQNCPELLDHYRNCQVDLSRMKLTRFVKNCTFFDVLAKSHGRVAELMRNPNFKANFELYDLSGFFEYTVDVRRAFERAEEHYKCMLEQEALIQKAAPYLPYPALRNLISYCKFPVCCDRSYMISRYDCTPDKPNLVELVQYIQF